MNPLEPLSKGDGMRVLRSSCYSRLGTPPTLAIVLDGDLTDTLEGAAHQAIDVVNGEALVLNDIFESDAPDMMGATAEAAKRSHEFGEQERHQAILYFWTVQTMLPRLAPAKSARYPGPIPLGRDQVIEVMEQVARHPNYKGQRLGVPTADGPMVILDQGKIR